MARIVGIDGVAELTISRIGPTLVIADRTFAPGSMRGMGAAKALLDRLIADARSEGFKFIPLCPCVKGQSLRHPEWADVLQGCETRLAISVKFSSGEHRLVDGPPRPQSVERFARTYTERL